jgi:hypothetical protein
MDCRVKPGIDETMMLRTADREAMRTKDDTDERRY